MAFKVAINGFGRIGRLAFRLLQAHKDIEIVAINDLTDTKTLAHLLKYDSIHGVWNGTISHDASSITIDGKKVHAFAEKDPANLPWEKHGIDLVIESTGFFTDKEKAAVHLKAGAKKVLISAPATGDLKTVVFNVNHKNITKDDVIVSAASCTTNALAPLAKVLDDNYGIVKGLMTTIHAYTNDQRLHDAPHKDLRRARAAAVNIIPSTTGAAAALGKVIPSLSGKLDGTSLRVPTITGSVVDLTVELKKDVTVQEINDLMKKSANESYGYNDEQIVSTDIIGTTFGSIFDPTMSMVVNVEGKKMYKLFTWYDNEASYVQQLIRVTKFYLNLK